MTIEDEEVEKTQPAMRFTSSTLRAFKKAKANAEAAGKETFVFYGHEFLVAYAKYLIEYMESQGL